MNPIFINVLNFCYLSCRPWLPSPTALDVRKNKMNHCRKKQTNKKQNYCIPVTNNVSSLPSSLMWHGTSLYQDLCVVPMPMGMSLLCTFLPSGAFAWCVLCFLKTTPTIRIIARKIGRLLSWEAKDKSSCRGRWRSFPIIMGRVCRPALLGYPPSFTSNSPVL